MTKISKISVTNLKSIQHQEIEMNGASIIVTAGNGKGKSTLTKSFFDRNHRTYKNLLRKRCNFTAQNV